MKRVFYWTIGLAVVGAVLGSKAATIQFIDILIGSLWGALAGLGIGWLVNRRAAISKKRGA